MARSSYIYVLFDTPTSTIIGTFTVKHEMQTAAKGYRGETYCMRYNDGRISHPTRVEVS
jgi:hypothetical protein